jgi:hypothetical protein
MRDPLNFEMGACIKLKFVVTNWLQPLRLKVERKIPPSLHFEAKRGTVRHSWDGSGQDGKIKVWDAWSILQ